MKYWLNLFLVLALSSVFTVACSLDENFDQSSLENIDFRVSVAGQSRVAMQKNGSGDFQAGDEVASWAFRFAGSPDGVLTGLSGMTYMEHLQDNIRTYSPLIPVTDEEKDFLEETAQLMMKYPTIPCNDCKYCMPCPYALDIPGILLHYNKCVNEGNVPKSAQDENYAKARRAFLVGYDRSVPKLRQANHCTGCEQCNPHCPQGIDIPKEMQRIDKFVEELKVNG